ELYHTVLTPVYRDTENGRVLTNVLVAGYPINHLMARRLKDETGGSEFLFLSPERVYASTLNTRATEALAKALAEDPGRRRISDGITEYAVIGRDLLGPQGEAVAKLYIFRSYADALEHIYRLRRDLILVWLLAMSAGLAVSYWVVRWVIRPVQVLDLAVAEIARQNYSYRVRVDTGDELGRLARAFNTMCDSLQSARDELIRQERLATIARLASSIVHDLRNPLAAIYGGAEMLLDDRLADAQKRRLATNIHRASQRIQAMLQDLANVSRGKTQNTELCSLAEVVEAAVDSQRALAEAHSVRINVDIPESVELVIERARVERVFLNLIGNALEAMPDGGEVSITARVEETGVVVEVEDTGPGISEEIRGKLFQPFVTFGKRNGLGLGLALARQTILDHGGDMWVSSEGTRGARFCLRLPMERRGAAVA
ncbi:MAG: HAMP domain-containing histidine kinase, partial [Bryobacteraceae bacterium]|nr:HAMP domain-containing histidine kinase [Bryobacteraceae bacterium]